jgi:hypothetical protein
VVVREVGGGLDLFIRARTRSAREIGAGQSGFRLGGGVLAKFQDSIFRKGPCGPVTWDEGGLACAGVVGEGSSEAVDSLLSLGRGSAITDIVGRLAS